MKKPSQLSPVANYLTHKINHIKHQMYLQNMHTDSVGVSGSCTHDENYVGDEHPLKSASILQ